jgi:hypothetical protein
MLNDDATNILYFSKCKNDTFVDQSLLHNNACNEESVLYRQAISNSVQKKLKDISNRTCKIILYYICTPKQLKITRFNHIDKIMGPN